MKPFERHFGRKVSTGEVNGIMDHATKEALGMFQEQRDLQVCGPHAQHPARLVPQERDFASKSAVAETTHDLSKLLSEVTNDVS